MFTSAPPGETDTSHALSTSVTYGSILIIGIWLIRSGVRDKKSSSVVISQHTAEDYNIKEKIMSTKSRFYYLNNKQYVLVVCAILACILLFYWFQYRPSRARIQCSTVAREKNSTLGQDGHYGDIWNSKGYDFDYKACLQAKGL